MGDRSTQLHTCANHGNSHNVFYGNCSTYKFESKVAVLKFKHGLFSLPHILQAYHGQLWYCNLLGYWGLSPYQLAPLTYFSSSPIMMLSIATTIPSLIPAVNSVHSKLLTQVITQPSENIPSFLPAYFTPISTPISLIISLHPYCLPLCYTTSINTTPSSSCPCPTTSTSTDLSSAPLSSAKWGQFFVILLRHHPLPTMSQNFMWCNYYTTILSFWQGLCFVQPSHLLAH